MQQCLIARSWNKPFVAGIGEVIFEENRLFKLRDPEDLSPEGSPQSCYIEEFEVITIDGTTGEVFNMDLSRELQPGSGRPVDRDKVLDWAYKRCESGGFRVRVNADTAEEVRAATQAKPPAGGIGLCRTESLLVKLDVRSKDTLRSLALSEHDADGEERALGVLEGIFTEQFRAIFAATEARQLPITIRLFDRLVGDPGGLLAAAPPIGARRGARLGILRRKIYEMQVRSLIEAVRQNGRGQEPRLEILIPYTIDPAEVYAVRAMVSAQLETASKDQDGLQPDWVPRVGAMIETPRAALLAEAFAKASDFLSYGIHDLSELVFGITAADEDLFATYQRRDLLRHDPWEQIDDSVGELVRMSADRARRAVPGIEIGVASEHAYDEDTVRLFRQALFNYISCLPASLPVALLVAAKAVIAEEDATVSASLGRNGVPAPTERGDPDAAAVREGAR